MKPLLVVATLLAAFVAVALTDERTHHDERHVKDHTKTHHSDHEEHHHNRKHHERGHHDRDHHDRDHHDKDHHDRDHRDKDHHDRHYRGDVDHISDEKEKAAEDAAAAAAEKAGDLDHTKDFDELDDRIDSLTARIKHLNDKIDERIDPERIAKAHSLEHRVVNIEGTGCGEREFQCGGDDPQCVGILLVCDGRKDCRNGADEESCDLHFHAGDVFDGHVITDTCTKRAPDVISFEIKSIRRDTYFNTVAFMRVNINIEFEDDRYEGAVSLPTVGYYHFGVHKLVVVPPESDRLGLVCEFDGSDWDTCHGEIKHEASGETCATLHFTRKGDSDEDEGDDD